MHLDFTEFGDGNSKAYCLEWLKDYTFFTVVYRSSFLIVVILNFVAQEFFIVVARMEGQMYSAQENHSIFQYIFCQSFINIGINLIFTDERTEFLKYMYFDTNWYLEVGT